MRFAAVVVAAGRSSRFGPVKKEYRLVDGRPVLERSLSVFLSMDGCAAVVAVVPPGGIPEARRVLDWEFLELHGARLSFAEGGAERADSVRAGLEALESLAPDIVLVHDGARPFAGAALVARVLEGVSLPGRGTGIGVACIPGIPVTDTIKRLDGSGMVEQHLRRSSLRAIQTPQAYPFAALLAVCRDGSLASVAASVTDDAELWAAAGGAVRVVDGERDNRKITFPEDLP